MNPISRVQPKAVISFNDITAAMTSRPALAVKIAECIAEYAEVEFELGSALGALLKSEIKIALAMYVENRRTTQLMMVRSAAKAALPSHHFKVFEAVMSKALAPAMTERDRLAHWCWGYSPDLPDCLLIMEPTSKTVNLATYFLVRERPIKIDRDKIYVLKESDLASTLKRIREARRLLRRFISTIWQGNSDAKRAQFLQELSDEPLLRTALSGTPSKPRANRTDHESQRPGRQQGRRAKS